MSALSNGREIGKVQRRALHVSSVKRIVSPKLPEAAAAKKPSK
jgi:hypothetical protein